MPGYPPDRHVLRDLRLTLLRSPGRADRILLPIVPVLVHPSGFVDLGALAVAVDVVAAGVAMRTIAPDWLATAELEIHAQARGPFAFAVAEPTLLRSGRTTTVFEVSVAGFASPDPSPAEAGTPLAHATMTFVRITRPMATGDLPHPEEPREEVRAEFALPESGLRGPLSQEMQLRILDAENGVVEMPASDFIVNSFGSLQGGLVAALAQAAAEAAHGARGGLAPVVTDLSVHYLAQGRGPYRTRSVPLRVSHAGIVHRIEIVDEPSGITMATAAATSSPAAADDSLA